MTYIMKMPASYVNVSKEEMEYDGRFAWVPFCAGISVLCSVASTVITLGCSAGWWKMDKSTQHTVCGILAGVGTITGLAGGIGWLNAGNAFKGSFTLCDTVLSDIATASTW